MHIRPTSWTVVLTLALVAMIAPEREAFAVFPTVTLQIEPTVALGPGETASIAGSTELDTTGCTTEQTGESSSCPLDMTLDITGVPDGVTACFVIDGGDCAPAPTPAAPIGAAFTLRLVGLSDAVPGVYTLHVLPHPIDVNLADGFHPKGQTRPVAMTVLPVTLVVDSEELPLELRAGSILIVPVQTVRGPGVGPVTVTASAGINGLGVSIDVDSETGEGTMTLSARTFVATGTYEISFQIDRADNGAPLRTQVLPVRVMGRYTRPVAVGAQSATCGSAWQGGALRTAEFLAPAGRG